MRLVGLCGKTGSGRRTVADILATAGFYRVDLDMPIVCGLQAMFGVHLRDLRTPKCEVSLPNTRITSADLIASLCDWGKNLCGADVWVRILEDHLAHWAMRESDPGVVVPFCTPETADLVRKLGGQVWHLYDRILTGRPILQTDWTLDFGSDAPFRHGDKAIDNSGNVDDLKSAVECLLLEMDR